MFWIFFQDSAVLDCLCWRGLLVGESLSTRRPLAEESHVLRTTYVLLGYLVTLLLPMLLLPLFLYYLLHLVPIPLLKCIIHTRSLSSPAHRVRSAIELSCTAPRRTEPLCAMLSSQKHQNLQMQTQRWWTQQLERNMIISSFDSHYYTSYHRRDFDLLSSEWIYRSSSPFSFNSSLHVDCRLSRSLETLDVLPPEFFHDMCSLLDIASLFKFSHTNERVRLLVRMRLMATRQSWPIQLGLFVLC